MPGGGVGGGLGDGVTVLGAGLGGGVGRGVRDGRVVRDDGDGRGEVVTAGPVDLVRRGVTRRVGAALTVPGRAGAAVGSGVDRAGAGTAGELRAVLLLPPEAVLTPLVFEWPIGICTDAGPSGWAAR